MKKILSIALLLCAVGYGQSTAIDLYLPDDNLDLATALTGHDDRVIGGLLPQSRSAGFTAYVKAVSTQDLTSQDFAKLMGEVESLRMNKVVGASSGVSGTTSLVSRVAAPAVLGVGVEYGSILQQSNGTVTTLRGNLLGVSRLALGQQQFPYCPEIAQDQCKPASRWLRRFSGSLSFEHVNTANGGTATVVPAGSTTQTTAQLFTSDNRMASWGARFDLTGSNNLDDPKYIAAWHAQIAKLRSAPETTTLLNSVGDLFQKATASELYTTWRQQAIAALKTISDKAAFKKELAHQLDDLIQRMSAADPNFQATIASLDKAYNNYFQVRDDLIREAQTNKFTLEYTNQHPLNQPFFSNVRLIYSHQPTNSQTLITLNAALTWYHQLPSGIDTGRLRDVQVSGQLDRRLGQVPKFGYAVFTLAGYFQYMQHDSIIVIGPGNMTPGSGIILPGTAATLLGTKGAIGVVQGKLSIPVAGTMKIPLSVTWSNRTELINEKDIRAQIGLTLDFDSLFH